MSLCRDMPRSIFGVRGVSVDMLVYKSVSESHIMSVLSPTRLGGC